MPTSKDEWTLVTSLEPEPTAPEPEVPPEPSPPATPEAEAEPVTVTVTVKKQKRSIEECRTLVKSCTDDTVGLLLLAVAEEALLRGIDPTVSVASVVKKPAGSAPMASIRDVWARVVARLDRTKRGGYRFDGTPIFGSHILGRDLSSTGIGEDGKAAPVVFGRKDMRGTFWVAVGEKGESFDMDGTIVSGMKLIARSSDADAFERLCDQVEALLAGVTAERVHDRRSTEEKLAAIDNWEE